MGPSRKRPRTKPPNVDESKSTEASQPLAEDRASTTTNPSTPVSDIPDNESAPKKEQDASTPLKNTKAVPDSVNQLKAKSSWYGTWPRKSTASTQVARETILADKPKNGLSSSDLSRFEPKKSPATVSVRPPGRPPSMCLGKSKETLDITMGGTLESGSAGDKETKPNESQSAGDDTKAKSTMGSTRQANTQPSSQPESEQRPTTSSAWLGGWLGGRATIQAVDVPESPKETTKALEGPQIKEAEIIQPEEQLTIAEVEQVAKHPAIPAPSTSWFGLWSTSAPSAIESPKEQVPIKVPGDSRDPSIEDAPPAKIAEPAAGSSWAFWSIDTSKKAGRPSENKEESGQLAISGEPSQHHPEPAKTTASKEDKDAKLSKRGRPISLEVVESSRKAIQLNPGLATGTPSQSPAPAKSLPENLLIPSVGSTYRLVENPSILQQIARLLLRGHQQPVKSVFLAKEPPKIKKALAIGIHGLFPAHLLRTVIGQPTGTSIKFANHAADAIRRWADAQGSLDCEIEKVALEGEGKIAERVDNLWKLLLNWIDHVRKADFVMVACHSQGVPVAVMLVAKLIEFGVVSTGKIGICAMAGVSLGPFADYKSRLFSGSAGELFEFANPESTVSKRYEDSLRVAVKYGVRVIYCGSIDDQLISLESSIFSTVSHPYIFRAVFVDGRIHAPDFLSHLVGFALKLRNLGVSDHGLIRELSAPLAGSLYTGEGHSRLYDEGKVYDLAVEYTLETTSVGDVPLQIKKYEIPTNANPYVLPWIMRGLLEEDFVKTELDAETTELLKQFDDWKPATKVLKDVKYRLEAVRSKL